MKRIYKWFNALSKRQHDSISGSVAAIGVVSTVLSVLGISLGDLDGINIWLRIAIVIAAFVIISVMIYMLIGVLFSDSVTMDIRNTSVIICHGDLFQTTHYNYR
ncbi:MAG: hypothetical protein LIP10_09495 [Clostridiales bacterium]|nr:hypothetical protein [Clostridiales bacterium]